MSIYWPALMMIYPLKYEYDVLQNYDYKHTNRLWNGSRDVTLDIIPDQIKVVVQV